MTLVARALTPVTVEGSSLYSMYIYTLNIAKEAFLEPLLPLLYWITHYHVIGHPKGYSVHITVGWLVFYAVAP